MTGYSVRRRQPSLWRQLTDPHEPPGLLARLIGGFLLGVALCLLLLVAGVLVLFVAWLASLGPVPGALGVAGLICTGCAVFAGLD